MPERHAYFSARRPGVTFALYLAAFLVAGVVLGVASYLLSGGPL